MPFAQAIWTNRCWTRRYAGFWEIVFRAAETEKGGSFDVVEHHALARRVAGEGMVLLKNNGILPLKKHKHIAVIGRAAREAYYQGGGSSHINPCLLDNPYDVLQKMAGDAGLSFAEGYPKDESFDQALIDEACENARSAEVALLYLALPPTKESEGYDRPDLDLTSHQVALIKAVSAVQPNTVVILNNGAPVVMSEWMDGTWHPRSLDGTGWRRTVPMCFRVVNQCQAGETFR
jgi:beta-glucosidase